MAEDTIYQRSDSDLPFRFDSAVADVFPDMLDRSIPGYAASIDAIGYLAARHVTANSRCYDLGCSLGAATIAMRQAVHATGVELVAVDNSAAMLDKCRSNIADEVALHPAAAPVEILCADIRKIEFHAASMVVLNYTLQFLPLADRNTLLQRIYESLLPGGVLVLSEKVIDHDATINGLLIELYHDFKRRNRYSDLEISRKRIALENVLIPETLADHENRLRQAGFDQFGVWLRYFNFLSIVAVR